MLKASRSKCFPGDRRSDLAVSMINGVVVSERREITPGKIAINEAAD